MPRKSKCEEKIRTTRCRQKNGDIYLLERKTKYNPKTKRSDVLSTKLLGKIVKGTDEIIPTRPKSPKGTHKRNGDVYTNNGLANRTRVGMVDIINHIGKESGIDDAIYQSTDIGTAQKIISLARYLLATGGQSLPGIEMWQFNHPLPYEHGISQNVYHDLFRSIGFDEGLQQQFFKSRARLMEKNDAIAFDSSTISTYSKNQIEARYGFNKAGDGLPTVKLLTLYSVEKRIPIAFTKISGNLPDVITQTNAIKQLGALGLDVIELITDNGYYSDSNLSELLSSNYHFITLAKTSLSWVKPHIDEQMDNLNSITTACSYDVETHCKTVTLKREFSKIRKYTNHSNGQQKGSNVKFTRRIHLHIYYNHMRAAQDQSEFEQDLMEIKQKLESGAFKLEQLSKSAQNKANKYLVINTDNDKIQVAFNDQVCRERGRYHGYFALVADKEKDAEQALRKYRNRERIESMFRAGKQSADMDYVRVWDSETLRGRLFVQFITLCYYEHFSEKIRQIKAKLGIMTGEKSHDTKENLDMERRLLSWMMNTPIYLQLQWFDTVEHVKISPALQQKRWTTEITMRDKMYLEKLGVELTK